jgi:hypothetical protein
MYIFLRQLDGDMPMMGKVFHRSYHVKAHIEPTCPLMCDAAC